MATVDPERECAAYRECAGVRDKCYWKGSKAKTKFNWCETRVTGTLGLNKWTCDSDACMKKGRGKRDRSKPPRAAQP